jgi:prolyl oligopeptidase
VVVDTYFGHKIADPYRWMETPGPELDKWMNEQNNYTRSVLNKIPGRDALARHMDAVGDGMTQITYMVRMLDQAFFLRKGRGENLRKLVVRDMKSGAEHILLDPNAMQEHGHHVAIDHFQPSWDGHFVAVGISSAGSEEDVLHIIDVTTGRMLPDAIDRARFASPSWLPDNHSFFYNRLHAPVASEPPSKRFDNSLVHVHQLGSDPERDPAVFGPGIGDTAAIPAQHFSSVTVLPGTAYAIGFESDGVSPSTALYVGRLPKTGAAYHWHKLADAAEGVTDITNRGDTLYLRTFHEAPRYRVISVPVTAPDLGQASVIIPAGDGIVTNVAAGSDALYVAERRGALSTLIRVAPDGKKTELKLPLAGLINEPIEEVGGLISDPRVPGAWVGIITWVSPTTWFGTSGGNSAIRSLGLAPAEPALSDYVVTETTCKARDGTDLPLSIIEKRGTPHDHRRPVLVDGYGAYGINSFPFERFVPVMRGWVDAGGVLAVAHMRGGGELGEAWHLAGKIATKQNTIHDFIDSSEAMIRLGYASQSTLAGMGTSAGGISIGGAITQRPDLFRAALIRVGATNMLRFELTEGGPANIPEFGTVTTKEGFDALYAMDALQHVQIGTVYPAVLLSAGVQDHRVPAWVSAKMAARMQAVGHAKGPVLLRVDYEGGHGTMGAGQKQANAEWADEFAFLLWQLGAPAYQIPLPKR